MIRVGIADDEALIRDGLEAIVGGHPDLQVVGTAANGKEAVALAADKRPDVILMDVRMPETDGIEATRQIVSAQTSRVLILTTVELDSAIYDSLRAGAAGFLLKSVHRSQLWAGIQAVATGDTVLAPGVAAKLTAHHGTAGHASMRLTERQTDVVRLVARGMSNLEIAGSLHLAESTVKGYLSEALLANGLRDRTQLVILAYESGLVRPGQG